MRRAEIFAYGVMGLMGGLWAGLHDALTATFVDAPTAVLLRVVSGTVGALGGVGLLLGLVVGVMAPFIPDELGLEGLVRRAGRRLWPGPDEPLQERAFTSAFLVTASLVLWVSLAVMVRAHETALSRIQSPTGLALVATAVALVVLTVAVAVALPLQAAGARILEFLVRRFPALVWLTHPVASLALVLGLGLWLALAWREREAETWAALDLRAVATLAVLGAVLLGGGALLRPRLGSVSVMRIFVLLLVAGGALPTALSAGVDRSDSLNVLGTGTGSTRFVLRVLRLPFDRDGDGFADRLGGGDCEDFDPGIHPGAAEIVGNGVDEDCDGEDLLAARTRPTEPASLPPAVRDGPRAASPAARGPSWTPAERRNLVLITVDALRADHLHFAGYARETSPALDALSRESSVFTNAYSTSSKTPTAVPSMLTGRYPGELLRDDEHFTTYGAENLLLAEVLHGHGWATSAFPSHWYFDAKYGLAQGFEAWQPFFARERQQMEKVATAEPLVVAALKHLENVLTPGGERPFFLWLHVLDPHKDYIAHPAIPEWGMTEPVDRYDHEIRYVDEWLGQLLAGLRKRLDWERTVVIVTSDHGEAFGEHGYRFHGFGLHEHQLRVPLLVRVPGGAQHVVDTPVSLIDLFPTVLELLGLPAPPGLALRGRSLGPALAGGALPAVPLYAETPKGPHNPERAALIEPPFKLLWDAEGDHYQLFNLALDPREKINRYRSEPDPALRLREALKRFRAERLTLRPPSALGPQDLH